MLNGNWISSSFSACCVRSSPWLVPADAGPDIAEQETPTEAANRLRRELGHDRIVCILGGMAFRCAESEALVKAIASKLEAALASKARFVTGGMAGVQETFAKHCGDASHVWNLLPSGQSSDYGRGTDIHAGADLEERKAVFGLIGDIYITVEGGPGVSKVARAAHERGAAVVPLMRTGRASNGMFDFPADALQKPVFATEEQWSLLSCTSASVDESAAAMAAIVEAYVAAFCKEETPAEAANRLRRELGHDSSIVCILGGTEFRCDESEVLVKAMASKLESTLASKAKFVTGGMAGVQETFAKHCGDGSRVWNLLPSGQASDYGRGTDINAGADLEERKAVFGLIGDIYITVEGGPGVSQEARAAHARGVAVVPLMRTGGASNGMFDFPSGALQKPFFSPRERWALLASKDASVDESAAAMAAVVESYVAAFCTKETPREAAKRLRGELGHDAKIICILGGTEFRGADSEALVNAIASKLESTLASQAKFVTGGMAGVQETFAKHCGDGSRVWNLLPSGQSSDYGRGTDINAGADLEERKAVFGLLGDIYITVEGGPGVSEEARAAHKRGAAVLPLMRTGGASNGMFDFPPDALQKPVFATEEQWSSLASTSASVDESAAVVAALVEAYVSGSTDSCVLS